MKNFVYVILLLLFLGVLGAFQLDMHNLALILSAALVCLTVFITIYAIVDGAKSSKKK